MGPLSAKQHREYLKLEADEQRKNAAFAQEQQRKEQLHKLKLQEAAAKASQGIAHKEQNQAVKLAEGTAKVPRINRQKLGLPSMNPLAGTEVLGPGQKRLPGMVPQGTDTVPAMLTPGEAVIPAPAAQDPKNKKAIKRMVQEGRKANKQNKGVLGFRDGTVNIVKTDSPQPIPTMGTYGGVPQQVQQAVGYADGTPIVPSLAYAHYDEPGSSYMNGSTGVQYYNDGVLNARRPGWQISDQALATPTPVEWIPPSEIGPAFVPPRTGRGFYKEPIPAYELAVPTTMAQLAGQEPIPRVAINADVPLTSAQERQRSVVTSKPNKPLYTPPDSVYTTAETKPIEVPAITPALLQAQREQESGNRMKDKEGRYVVSKEGAIGTAQLIPSTAYNPGFGVRPLVGEEIYDENKQISFQSDYMNAMYNRYKDTSKALTAYNAGPGTVDKAIEAAKKAGDENRWKEFLPTTEAKEYSNKVLSRINKDERLGINDPRVIKNQSNTLPEMPDQQIIEVPLPGEEPKQEQPSLIKSDPETANQSIANIAFENQGSLAKLLPEASKQEDPQGFLQKAVASLYGDKGLFNTQELARFALVAAGGMIAGFNPGQSLKYAARDVLAAADRRNAENFRAEQQQRQFEQQEAMLDKRFEKEMSIRRDDVRRAEDKQLESEMIKEGRDAVAVRNWIKSGQKGEPPAIKTSYIRNGKSELMTVIQPIKIGDRVFKPGDPMYVYETIQQTGNRKGEVVQMVRIGDKDVPFDLLQNNKMVLTKWDDSKYGNIAKLKRAEDFSESTAEKILEPIFVREFGASKVKDQANPKREGIVTSGVAAQQLRSFFQDKVDLDDLKTQGEVKKIVSIAAEQLAADIKSGTFKSVKDITPYLAAGEFREKGKLSDKLITLDKKSGKLMSADDILSLRTAVQVGFPKSIPESEIQRLASVWESNSNNVQNKYKNSDQMTGFAQFVLDISKQAQNKK